LAGYRNLRKDNGWTGTPTKSIRRLMDRQRESDGFRQKPNSPWFRSQKSKKSEFF